MWVLKIYNTNSVCPKTAQQRPKYNRHDNLFVPYHMLICPVFQYSLDNIGSRHHLVGLINDPRHIKTTNTADLQQVVISQILYFYQ